MKKILTLVLLMSLLACPVSAQVKAFDYFQSFDNPADFPDDAEQPIGWTAEGDYPLTRYQASWTGKPAYSGDYVYFAPSSSAYGRTEVSYTPAFRLAANRPCTISFYYMTPGGNVPRRSSITLAVGETPVFAEMHPLMHTPSDVTVTTWTRCEATFTPSADGTYYFAFKLNAEMAQAGFIFIDDLEIEGFEPEEVVEPEPQDTLDVATLEALRASAEGTVCRYTGDAQVNFVHNGTLWVQDASGAMLLEGSTLDAVQRGSVITGFAGTMSRAEGFPTFTVTQNGTHSPESVQPILRTLTLEELLAHSDQYLCGLYRFENLSVQDFEPGDVFEEGTDYQVADADAHTAALSLQFATDLLDTAIPTEQFSLVALVSGTNELAPRSMDDVEEYLPPVVHETEALSYFQSFDNTDNDYVGGYLPRGWERSGSVPFVTANMDILPAVTGTYYMVTASSSVPRDESAYTPFFNMKAGQEYKISFFLYMPGITYDGITNCTNFSFTAGTDQNADAQTITLIALPTGTSLTEWTKQECTFVPTADGQYCFAFNIFSNYPYAGDVAVDDVMIFDGSQPLKPSAAFTTKGWFDITTSDAVVFANTPVQMVNLSTQATEYEWTVDGGAEPNFSDEVNPAFVFPHDGTYHITLTAKNAAGQRTAYRTLNVSHLDDTKGAGLINYNPSDDRMLYTYETIPTFETDPMFDFITGPNHYYTEFAERFEFPESTEFTITSLNIYLSAYSRHMSYRDEEMNQPFSITFMGDKDGLPDETNIIGQKKSTIVDEFGSVGLGYERQVHWGFTLPTPLTVSGKFYVAFRFGDDNDQMVIDSPEPSIARSYVAYTVVEHKANNTTIFVKPTAAPEGYNQDLLGKWTRLDNFDQEKAGLGTYLVLWGYSPTGVYAVTADGALAFDVKVQGRTLFVSGTTADDTIYIYDTNGRLMKTEKAAARCSSLNLDTLPTGVYVVKTAQGSRKFSL